MTENEYPCGVCNSYPCVCDPLDYIDDKPECFGEFDDCTHCNYLTECEERTKEREGGE